MKKYLFLTTALVCSSLAGFSQLLRQLEYFVDGPDPGFGLATQVPFTPATDITETFTVSMDGLSLGAHSLNVRVQDDSLWSVTTSRPFYLASVAGPNIAEVEYFIDSDPGFGNGTPVSFTPGTDVTTTFAVDLTGLPDGLHVFNIRVKSHGSWSLVKSSPFYASSVSTTNISAIEYFVDSDPGFGSGTPVSFTPGTDVTTSFSVPAGGLTGGLHVLTVRVKDAADQWSLAYSSPFYLTSPVSSNIAEMEYYIDADPGYGLGVAIPFTPSGDVSTAFTVNTSAVPNGLHILNIRVKDTEGKWSITQASPFYIAPEGTTNVTAMEYFVDSDPGFGLATPVTLTPASDVTETFAVDISGYGTGLHTFNIRVQDETGVWSIVNTVPFYTVSAATANITAIEYFIDTDPGPGSGTSVPFTPAQTINESFIIDATAISPGLHVANVRVKDENGFWSIVNSSPFIVTKSASNIIGYEYAVDVDPGLGSGTFVPSAAPGLNVNEVINVDLTGKNEGPHLLLVRAKNADGSWGLTNTYPIEVCNLLPPVADPAALVTTNSFKAGWTSVPLATNYKLDVSTDNFETFLPGYENNPITALADTVRSLTPNASYQYRIRASKPVCSSVYSDTISVTTYQVTVPGDSLTLVQLYTATDGANWSASTNWLSGPVASWHGIGVTASRVTEINLEANGLSGAIPAAITALSNLNSIDISNNDIVDLPDMTLLINLANVDIANNKLTFEDIEPNVFLSGIVYAPQQTVGVGDTISVDAGEPLNLAHVVGGSANMYQWVHDGAPAAGETSSAITRSAVAADAGQWRLDITNSIVPGLTLRSANTLVIVILGISGDSTKLVAFYNATGGANWTDNTNWLTGDVTSWVGITVVGNKVTAIELPGNNVNGAVPADLAGITDLEVIDLHNNGLTSLPDLSSLAMLTSLNVSDNRLQFESLEPNIGIAGFSYANQAEVGTPSETEIYAGDPYEMEATVGGANNQYVWKKDGAVMAGENSSTLLIPEMNRAAMAEYVAEVTNTSVPGLTIRTAPETLIGVADISGSLFVDEAVPASLGDVQLLRVQEENGFDTVAVTSVNSVGEYLFEAMVLDDYMVVGMPDPDTYERALPTYYPSTLYWEEADTVFLEFDEFGIDVMAQFDPADTPPGQGVIRGILWEDDGTGEGRTHKPRRVSNAGVSARRVERTGRGKEDVVLTLVDYQFTNDQGEFEFTNLTEDEFLLNVQYPGYPMDLESDVNVMVGSGLESEKVVEANVEEGKIVVRELVITGIWMPEIYHMDVYPNPTAAEVTFEFVSPSQGRSVRLIDVTGKEIMTVEASGRQRSVNLRELPRGTYIVNVNDKGALVASKMLTIN